MSPRSRPLLRREALAILATIALACTGVVWLCDWLILPGELLAELPALDDEVPDPVPGRPACPPAHSPPPGDTGSPVSSTALVECPGLYDGELVRFDGEVVQAVLRRGERAWVQLNDDPYGLSLGPLATHRTAVGGNAGMAVSIPADVAESIQHLGRFDASGDVISVLGEFRQSDPEDGGGFTIHAHTAAITQRGGPIEHGVSSRRIMTAAVLLGITCALALTVVWSRLSARR